MGRHKKAMHSDHNDPITFLCMNSSYNSLIHSILQLRVLFNLRKLVKLIMLSRNERRNLPTTTKIASNVDMIEFIVKAAKFNYQFATLWFWQQLLRNG